MPVYLALQTRPCPDSARRAYQMGQLNDHEVSQAVETLGRIAGRASLWPTALQGIDQLALGVTDDNGGLTVRVANSEADAFALLRELLHAQPAVALMAWDAAFCRGQLAVRALSQRQSVPRLQFESLPEALTAAQASGLDLLATGRWLLDATSSRDLNLQAASLGVAQEVRTLHALHLLTLSL